MNIEDIKIRIYELHEDTHFTLGAYNGATKVGYAHLTIEGSIATLVDIKTSVIRIQFIPFLPWLKKTINYRSQGVGTELLSRVINICNKYKVDELRGEMHGDIPRLTRWYEKHGFNVNKDNKIMKILCV